MKTNEVLYKLRKKNDYTQEELANKLFVTRQAISRWETGETVPSTDILKELSKLYNVSINTLLGSPNKLICQCCGMPLEDEIISREVDDSFNEEFCKWCYHDGIFEYDNIEDLLKFFVKNYPIEEKNELETKEYYRSYLKDLKKWK